MNKRLETPIPFRMQSLERDPRGYPIPFIVFRDMTGKPHFTINDSTVVRSASQHKLCGICGQKMVNGYWFIGGPKSAFHEYGAYIDGPLHKDCANYALKVCPYLVLSRYKNRVDDKTIDYANVGPNFLVADPTMDPNHPEFFVLSKTTSYSASSPGVGLFYHHPKKPWREVVFYRQGEEISFDAGCKIVRECYDDELILPARSKI